MKDAGQQPVLEVFQTPPISTTPRWQFGVIVELHKGGGTMQSDCGKILAFKLEHYRGVRPRKYGNTPAFTVGKSIHPPHIESGGRIAFQLDPIHWGGGVAQVMWTTIERFNSAHSASMSHGSSKKRSVCRVGVDR